MTATAWVDQQGDMWTLDTDGLLHTPETNPFPREYVEKKWGPLTPVVEDERDELGCSKTYRFWLSRHGLGGAGAGHIVMLNPSTADQYTDDPTIRRCMGFAHREGYHSLTVVNLYGLRATNPADLWAHPDPVGVQTPERAGNDSSISTALMNAGHYSDGRVIVAWGAHARQDRVDAFLALVGRCRVPVSLWCLGVTKSGAPRHPLYVRADQPLVPWPVAS